MGMPETDLYVSQRPKYWILTANEFYERTNFPNCIGAVDGKHIRIRKPVNRGSQCFSYFFSTVLMAVADADYCFISVEVGAYGSLSDSNVLKSRPLESYWRAISEHSRPQGSAQ
jgi:hypothetical protein